jgi:hypothetical protein
VKQKSVWKSKYKLNKSFQIYIQTHRFNTDSNFNIDIFFFFFLFVFFSLIIFICCSEIDKLEKLTQPNEMEKMSMVTNIEINRQVDQCSTIVIQHKFVTIQFMFAYIYISEFVYFFFFFFACLFDFYFVGSYAFCIRKLVSLHKS